MTFSTMADVSDISISTMWKAGSSGLGAFALAESRDPVYLFCHQNSVAVAYLLAEMDGESLFDLLDSLSREDREPFLKMFGLLERWYQLRRWGKQRIASLRALLP